MSSVKSDSVSKGHTSTHSIQSAKIHRQHSKTTHILDDVNDNNGIDNNHEEHLSLDEILKDINASKRKQLVRAMRNEIDEKTRAQDKTIRQLAEELKRISKFLPNDDDSADVTDVVSDTSNSLFESRQAHAHTHIDTHTQAENREVVIKQNDESNWTNLIICFFIGVFMSIFATMLFQHTQATRVAEVTAHFFRKLIGK